MLLFLFSLQVQTENNGEDQTVVQYLFEHGSSILFTVFISQDVVYKFL
jgi:hypothetical protein